jgi:putative transposase
MATAPNQVEMGHHEAAWPGEVDLLLPLVLIDIFSRDVVAGSCRTCERRTRARTRRRVVQKIHPGNLGIHADRGTSMTSKSLALPFADLGVTKPHFRPHISDENPFSEARSRP